MFRLLLCNVGTGDSIVPQLQLRPVPGWCVQRGQHPRPRHAAPRHPHLQQPQ